MNTLFSYEIYERGNGDGREPSYPNLDYYVVNSFYIAAGERESNNLAMLLQVINESCECEMIQGIRMTQCIKMIEVHLFVSPPNWVSFPCQNTNEPERQWF
jgi:hypothetical protein